MSLVAEFTIPAAALPGGQTLEAMPELRVELERIVPSQEATLPFFWVWGDDAGEFLEHLEKEPEIEAIHVLDRVEDGVLYRARWAPEAEIIVAIKELEATILEAVGSDDEWRFQIRAQDRDRFIEFREIFTEQEIPVELTRLYNLAELVEGEHYQITQKQREVLTAAFRRGYFDDPRQTSQEQLGEEFEISGRAISKRLRLGTRNLIASTLVATSRDSES